MKTDIILAGVGGQGILSIATVLGEAALRSDIHLKQAEVHGMSQRGGDVMSCLRLSDRPICSDLIPRGKADLIISLEPMEALRYSGSLSPRGRVVTSTVPVENIPDYPAVDEVMTELEAAAAVTALDADDIARRAASPRAANMALLGAASPFLPFPAEVLRECIAAIFAAKGDKIVADNIAAFDAGREAAEA